jgi:hypothetical protein
LLVRRLSREYDSTEKLKMSLIIELYFFATVFSDDRCEDVSPVLICRHHHI